MKLFLQKNAKFSSAGSPPPDPRASGGWGLCPQTPSLRQLGASLPDPHCEFLATRLAIAIAKQVKSWDTINSAS